MTNTWAEQEPMGLEMDHCCSDQPFEHGVLSGYCNVGV